MSPIVSVDPGNTYTGISILRDGHAEMHSIRIGQQPQRVFQEQIVPLLQPLAREGALLGIEQPPRAVRADMRHGPQTPIGHALGLITGLIGCLWLVEGRGFEMIEVSAWRSSMLVWAARQGLAISKPSKADAPGVIRRGPKADNVERMAAGGFRVTYRCGHSASAANYTALTTTASECPECLRGRGPVLTRSEAITDRWKQRACQVVKHGWPAPYAGLVEAAKGRAKVIKPDHRLAGVSDACEAVMVGIHMAVQNGN